MNSHNKSTLIATIFVNLLTCCISLLLKFGIVYCWLKWIVIPIVCGLIAAPSLASIGFVHALCILVSLNILWFVSSAASIRLNELVENKIMYKYDNMVKKGEIFTNEIPRDPVKNVVIVAITLMTSLIYFIELFIVSCLI